MAVIPANARLRQRPRHVVPKRRGAFPRRVAVPRGPAAIPGQGGAVRPTNRQAGVTGKKVRVVQRCGCRRRRGRHQVRPSGRQRGGCQGRHHQTLLSHSLLPVSWNVVRRMYPCLSIPPSFVEFTVVGGPWWSRPRTPSLTETAFAWVSRRPGRLRPSVDCSGRRRRGAQDLHLRFRGQHDLDSATLSDGDRSGGSATPPVHDGRRRRLRRPARRR